MLKERSENIDELVKALVAFRKSVKPISKTADNPYYKSKYAPLGDIIDAIQDPMANAGLELIQLPDGEGAVESILMHTS